MIVVWLLSIGGYKIAQFILLSFYPNLVEPELSEA